MPLLQKNLYVNLYQRTSYFSPASLVLKDVLGILPGEKYFHGIIIQSLGLKQCFVKILNSIAIAISSMILFNRSMADFQFLENTVSKRWVILAPRRATRPDSAKGTASICPFCVGRAASAESSSEPKEKELDRIGGKPGDEEWEVRVLPNKFPFTPHHEIIVHSPDHHKSFDELPLAHVVKILHMFKKRFLFHKNSGQVYIFHNHGEAAGESLPHPHSQLTVVPFSIHMDIPILRIDEQVVQQTDHFTIFCPLTSEWPDEIWIAPKKRGQTFGEIDTEQLEDFAFVLQRLLQIHDYRHGHEFPYNFYIYPGHDWYLRIIPRIKVLGGFELGTTISVNTQDPRETMNFITEHFAHPDAEKIKSKQRAEYKRSV